MSKYVLDELFFQPNYIFINPRKLGKRSCWVNLILIKIVVVRFQVFLVRLFFTFVSRRPCGHTNMNESFYQNVQGLFKSPKDQNPTASLNKTRLPISWAYENLSSMPPGNLLQLLQQVPGMLEAKTIEVKTILPSIIKLCASNNFQIKDAVCNILIVVAEQDEQAASEIGLLVGNILFQDLLDPNPSVRSTAVSAICSISVLANQYAFRAITNGLKDSNPKVRKSAVVGCGKVWRHSPQIIEEHGLIDVLYMSVRDTDPNVLTFAMQTLNIILEGEGGIVINQNMATYLLQRYISKFAALLL